MDADSPKIRISTLTAARVPRSRALDHRFVLCLDSPVFPHAAVDVLPPFTRVARGYERPVRLLVAGVPDSLVRSGAARAGVTLEPQNIRPLRLRDTGTINLLHAIAQAEGLSGETRDAYVQSLGAALAVKLAIFYAFGAKEEEPGKPEERVARVVDYIAAHFSERLSIRDLARLANMSESYLKSQFREAMGTTIHRYIVGARVQFALRELSSGHAPLSELADRAGFADQSHMTRWIKRIAGVAPHRYARTAS